MKKLLSNYIIIIIIIIIIIYKKPIVKIYINYNHKVWECY